MMKIDELKELERKLGSGWRFVDNTDDRSECESVRFLNTFLGMRKELLALWSKARWCQEWTDGYELDKELEALEIKLDQMDI